MGRGSLSFLGPKYPITLAEVWEAIITELRENGYDDSEESAEIFYLDDSARAALAEGKVQLAAERAKTAEIGSSSQQQVVPDPIPAATKTNVDIEASIPPKSPTTNAPLIEDRQDEAHVEASQEEHGEGDETEANKFEIETIPP